MITLATIERPNTSKLESSYAYLATINYAAMPVQNTGVKIVKPTITIPMTRPIDVKGVKHSKRKPITFVTPAKGTTRVVGYKVVKVITIKIGKNKYNVGESWGLRYGLIRMNGEKRIVVSRQQNNGSFSAWELLPL